MNRDRHYAAMADKEEGRDHDIRVAYAGRIVASEGAFGRAWLKFNKADTLVWVTTIDGRMVGLTPWQAKVYDLARTYIDTGTVRMRAMASTLGCSPSTVSRALVKLMSWGLLGYIVGRGRYSGMIVFRMHKGDGLDRFRQSAKAKVAAWKKASEERVSRLWLNVAPYLHGREVGSNYSENDPYLVTSSKGATLTAQPFSVQELRDSGII